MCGEEESELGRRVREPGPAQVEADRARDRGERPLRRKVESLGSATGATEGFVERLAAARIGSTFNFYREGARARLLRERLAAYLGARASAEIVLVAEAPGYRGTRISGIPLTSERQLTGEGPAEATATIVHGALEQLGAADDVLLWNVVPTHPGDEGSNRRPTRAEVSAGLPFALELARGRRVIAVGRLAHDAFGGCYVRHPSRGGAAAFRRSLEALLVRESRAAPLLVPSSGRRTRASA